MWNNKLKHLSRVKLLYISTSYVYSCEYHRLIFHICYLISSSRNDRHLEKDPRDFRSARDNDRDRDRDFRNPRERFDRDDRKFERDRIFSRRDMDDRVSCLIEEEDTNYPLSSVI
jgi:hypothetical protein